MLARDSDPAIFFVPYPMEPCPRDLRIDIATPQNLGCSPLCDGHLKRACELELVTGEDSFKLLLVYLLHKTDRELDIVLLEHFGEHFRNVVIQTNYERRLA